MVGMLGLGIVIRNVPYIDFGKYLPSTVASPIRYLHPEELLVRVVMRNWQKSFIKEIHHFLDNFR